MDYSFQPTTELEQVLQKPAAQFTRRDIIDVMTKEDIRLLNFRYAGGDGKLKLLNFALVIKNIWRASLRLGNV